MTFIDPKANRIKQGPLPPLKPSILEIMKTTSHALSFLFFNKEQAEYINKNCQHDDSWMYKKDKLDPQK